MVTSAEKCERSLSACPLASPQEILDIQNRCRTLLKTLKNRYPAEWMLTDEAEFLNDSNSDPASVGVINMEEVLLSNEFETCPRADRRNFLLQHCSIDDWSQHR